MNIKNIIKLLINNNTYKYNIIILIVSLGYATNIISRTEINNDDIIDIAVLGSGPSGLTAGMYGSRAGYNTVIFSGPMEGGQLMGAAKIENWPGVKTTSGKKAISNLKDQVLECNTPIYKQTISKLHLDEYPFRLVTNKDEEFKARSIIIATGTSPRKLNIPGEKKYWGNGVALCALCDAPLYKNKDVLIIGENNKALEQVNLLKPYANKIYLATHSNKFKASNHIQQKVKSIPKVKILLNTELQKIIGDDKNIMAGKMHNSKIKKSYILPVSGIFISIGQDANTDFAGDQLELSHTGYIITNCHDQSSSVKGVFAAGNVVEGSYKQAAIACGLGANAALGAKSFLEKNNIKPNLKKKDNNMMILNQQPQTEMNQKADLQSVQTIETKQKFENYFNDVKSEQLTLVFIFSPMCPHCERMIPLVNKLKENNDNLDIIKVNINQAKPELIGQISKDINQEINGVPRFVLYKGSKFINTTVGEMELASLEKFIS